MTQNGKQNKDKENAITQRRLKHKKNMVMAVLK